MHFLRSRVTENGTNWTKTFGWMWYWSIALIELFRRTRPDRYSGLINLLESSISFRGWQDSQRPDLYKSLPCLVVFYSPHRYTSIWEHSFAIEITWSTLSWYLTLHFVVVKCMPNWSEISKYGPDTLVFYKLNILVDVKQTQGQIFYRCGR